MFKRYAHQFANFGHVLFILLSFFSCSTPPTSSVRNSDDLEAGFQNPPQSAQPRVWWHWMNGNVTKEGINADLKWMKRIGIGGFQNFDAFLNTPQVVTKRLVYMSPEWKDAFQYTTKLADSLGLEMAIAASPGWSESGGPWVPASQAMKKYVWSELVIEGGKPFSGVLPQPPTNAGAFQNMKIAAGFGMNGPSPTIPEYYADAVVVAYQENANFISFKELNPKVSSSGGNFTLQVLTDGDLVSPTLLPNAGTNKAFIQFEFDQPQTFQAISLATAGAGGRGFGGANAAPSGRSIESSDDGITFKTLTTIPAGGVGQQTVSFTPTTAKFFRFSASPVAAGGGGRGGAAAPAATGGTQITELVLHAGSRLSRFEEKAAFSASTNVSFSRTSASTSISKSTVIDLTSKLLPDGTLNWTPPPGKWTVLRIGNTLTGHHNDPAVPEATGLEVDKLSGSAVKAYFENYLNQYQDASGGLMGKTDFKYIITDSWEAGVQNWTDEMIAEFSKHRGYSMIPWIPVLTGRVVESTEASEKFLWDFRKTIAELTVENHYDQLTKILEERGMKRYSESHESGRAFIADGMDVKRTAAVPMSATWTPGGFGGNAAAGVTLGYRSDVRESASVAHIYGQNLVAAESLTASSNAWGWSPEALKPTADMEMANGLNRFVIHTSVHQPFNDKLPGIGLGPFGQWFTRHETWSEQAKAWMTYLSRNSFMLQQGKFVADIVYFYGEDLNITALFSSKLPDIPEGINYDYINAHALLNLLEVKDNQLSTPSGMKYRVLALDSASTQMTLPVLKKIQKLVKDGAIVVGPKPIRTPSLSDNDSEFKTIVAELWPQGSTDTKIGNGRLIPGSDLKTVIDLLQIKPDFSYSKPQPETQVLFVHRKKDDQDIYWVNNRNTKEESIQATFRVEGKVPELWHPDSGLIEPLSYSIRNGQTTIPLHLDPSDAVFVVFRKSTTELTHTIASVEKKELQTLDGSWNVSLKPKQGAATPATLDKLSSWSDNTDNNIKYFSGTGTYTKSFTASQDWFKSGTKFWLSLGDVKNIAEVTVNGKSLGILWKRPFDVDITSALKSGQNTVEIKVTNLWVNRLIGDQQPGVTKSTFTTQAFYQATSPLVPAGLLGPVKVIGEMKK